MAQIVNYNVRQKEPFLPNTVQSIDLSFGTSDCTPKLIKKLFESKFSGAQTKTEAIIVNVISPYIFDELLKDLKIANFVTLAIDNSNRKEVKLTPVCVRYFNQNGVNVRILYFDELPGETSNLLVEHFFEVYKKIFYFL